jgi:glycosyltransferase involved in cell wall biosynthesis
MRPKMKIKKNNTLWINSTTQSYPRRLKIPFFQDNKTTQLVMVTTFPPRECGIATYAQDLIKALNEKFTDSFNIQICALENGQHQYSREVNYVLETNQQESYVQFAQQINEAPEVNLVVIQHEFGLFRGNEDDLLKMTISLQKAVAIVFHTVLPRPDKEIQQYINKLSSIAATVIVMTNNAKAILEQDYLVPYDKIKVIPHGTHLVEHPNKETLKQKYDCEGKKVLSTFGLLSSGKSIETTLKALPEIIKYHPDSLFLIIGKTHPTVVKEEGERYREYLGSLIEELQIKDNVLFVNEYLNLETLLEYLQLTDIYLFTSKDPNQAVSGTFSYAISCGCPIISTPIPHALEVLQKGTGRIFNFENSGQLAQEVIALLNDDKTRHAISLNCLHEMAPTAWENSAVSHAKLFENINGSEGILQYKKPPIHLSHLKKMTTDFGIIQFSVINQPDLNSGYTLDDNARALIVMCQHFKITRDKNDLIAMECYLNFIIFCLQPTGYFANYVSKHRKFTKQNKNCNLEDSFGRAIWALGYLLSLREILPAELIAKTQSFYQKALLRVQDIHSTRAMAFSIKGIYYANLNNNTKEQLSIIEQFADRLVQMYKHEADKNWQWFESYLTYANSILPEAMLYAWLTLRKTTYQSIALLTFDFLLSSVFTKNHLQVISNKGWMHNGQVINFDNKGGEQPIDVAYTIMALSEFYNAFKIEDYNYKMHTAFNWFLGQNHLNQIVYNPCTGGCYDGLESSYINLNQGAESTISYLMARLTLENNPVDDEKINIRSISKFIKKD